jgi:hypothetical protein
MFKQILVYRQTMCFEGLNRRAKGESSDLCPSGSRPLPTFVLGLQCATKALRRNCSLMRAASR